MRAITILVMILHIFSADIFAEDNSIHQTTEPDSTLQRQHIPNYSGYTLIMGAYLCGYTTHQAPDAPDRTALQLGFAKTQKLHSIEADAFADKYFLVEVTNFEKKIYWGFLTGVEIRDMIDVGIGLNYITNFNSKHAIALRPSIGMLIPPLGQFYIEMGWNAFLWSKNFYLGGHWTFGIRYSIDYLTLEKNEKF